MFIHRIVHHRPKRLAALAAAFERYSLAAVIIASLGAAATPVKADQMVYVAGSGNEFGTLDLNTGGFTEIGTLNLPANDNIFGMGFGSNGTLYGLDSSFPMATLYTINTSNAETNPIGVLTESAIDASADAAGVLFGLSADTSAVLYTLDPSSTGATTQVVGPTGISSTGLAAVTANGSAVYAGAFDPDTALTDLYLINTATGVSTLIGDTGADLINGLFVDGTLYGFDDVTDAIDTINTMTGAATQIATYHLPNGDVVFASATDQLLPPVPEPGSLVLLGIGLAGIALKRRRNV